MQWAWITNRGVSTVKVYGPFKTQRSAQVWADPRKHLFKTMELVPFVELP